MTGANWVAHPLVAGIPDFEVTGERYCLHIDPSNHVPVTSWFPTVSWYHSPNGTVDMPVVWTRSWGRVHYNALGHRQNVIASGPA